MATIARSGPYRRDIDGLRAIAILAVIGFHAFPAWMTGGYVGVDVFFVISGFLISGILIDHLEQGRFSLIDFYAHRIRRIFPALILVLATMLAFGALVLWPDEFRRLGRHVAGGAGFIINFILCGETGYFQESGSVQPALHLWSLAIEEQFYIFWPLVLAFVWKHRRHAGILLPTIFFASFVYSQHLAAHSAHAAFYSPFSRFWELLAGGLCAWMQRHPFMSVAGTFRPLLAASGLAAIGVATVFFNDQLPFPGWYAVLPVAGAVAVLMAGESTFLNRRLLSNPVMVGIGLISYPLYLWHWPLLSYAHILSGGAPSRELRLGMVAAAFILAAATTYLVERPIRRRELTLTRAALLVGLIGILGLAGVAAAKSGGWPQRFDAAQAQSLDSAKLIEGWQTGARVGTCHLQDVKATQPSADCSEDKRPLLALWGDSHAATLYPGLRALQETQGFGIAQLTQAGCSPLFDIPASLFRGNCKDINERVLSDMARLKPNAVLLSAAWSHKDYPMDNATLAAHLKDSLARLRQAAPTARLIVVGPVPRWTAPLPALYRREISFTRALPPALMNKHLVPGLTALDAALRAAAEANNALYLSPADYLCDGSACLTRLGDSLDSIAYVDEEHLSPAASQWLMTRLTAAAPLFQASDNAASR